MPLRPMIPFKLNAQDMLLKWLHSVHVSDCSLTVKLNFLATTKFGLGMSHSGQCKKHLKHITCTLSHEAEKDTACSMFPQRTSGEHFYSGFALPD